MNNSKKLKRSNKDFCPECNEKWEYCECDEHFPEPELIKMDDEFIASSIDFEV